MGIFNFAKRNVTKAINTVARSKLFEGYFNQVITIPPSMNTADFLRAYGQIGWLFACVNRISQNVASNEWKAYKGETVQQSSLALNVLKKPNPFMSQFQLLWKTTAFLELTGRCYWYIAKDGIGRPKEIWCISPLDMWVIPDKDNYIKGYKYKAGAVEIFLSVDEIIAFQLPDLINPYSGISPSQAAANDLEADKYTSQYVRNFFYNDARPAGIVNFPDISDDDYERAKEQWNDKYRGVENSSKMAFTRGGEVTFTPITMNIKDLDVSNLKDKSRDGILGTFGVPKSILGITDDVNRANAETAEYTFAKHTIKPLLQLVQDILNNEYVPMFKEQSDLKFVDPVPENKEFTKSVLDTQVDKSITKNEAREVLNKLLGLNLKPLLGGDVIYQPVSQQPMGTALPTQQSAPKEEDKPVEEDPPNEPTKSVKKNFLSKAIRKKIARLVEKNNKTRQEEFLKLAEPLQEEFNKVIQGYFKAMQKEIVSKILDGSKDPVDLKKWNKELQDKTVALYVKCFKVGGQSVVNEFKAIGNYIHKDTRVQFDVKDPKVQKKIQNKVSKITEVNQETKDKVKSIIEDMYNSEDDFTIRDIAKKIASEDFYEFSPARAKTVAQTETLTSLNQATIEGYKQNSDLIDGKAWLPSFHNTRQSHLDAGAEYSMDTPISVDEAFNVGGYDCECPGDDSLPASEVVCCACCMSPVINVD